jgi:TonB family protein
VVRAQQIGFLLILASADCACGTFGQKTSSPKDPGTPSAANDSGQKAVLLRIRVGTDGSVREAHVLQGAGKEVDDLALDAISKAKFNPARQQDGTPVESVINHRVVVKLR